MITKHLKKLKAQLPSKYGKTIAGNLQNDAITARTVVLVFNGQITNTDLVTPIVEEAIKLVAKTKKLQQKLALTTAK